MNRRPTLHLVWVLLIAVLAPAAVGADDDWALSDVRDYDWYWFRSPPELIAPREAERFGEDLGLTDAQGEALTAMIVSAAREFEDGWLVLAERFDDLRYSPDAVTDRDWRTRRRQMRALHLDAQSRVESARTQLFSDLQILLTADQASRWEGAMRAHRRRTTLVQYANLDGETVDLIGFAELLDGLTDEQRARVDAELASYATDLDAALASRRASRENLERACRRFDEVREDQAEKEEIRARMSDVVHHALRTLEASRRIREINDRYAVVIGDMLGEAEREDLKDLMAEAPRPGQEDEWGPRGLRMLRYARNLDAAAEAARVQGTYERSSWSQSMALAARGVEPLTDEQRDRIDALRDAFKAEQSRLRGRYDVSDERNDNPNNAQIRSEAGMVQLSRTKPVDPPERNSADREAYNRELASLSEDTVAKLREILTVRQRIMLQARE